MDAHECLSDRFEQSLRGLLHLVWLLINCVFLIMFLVDTQKLFLFGIIKSLDEGDKCPKRFRSPQIVLLLHLFSSRGQAEPQSIQEIL